MTNDTMKRFALGFCACAAAVSVIATAGPALTANDDPASALPPASTEPGTPPALAKAIKANQVTVVVIYSKKSTLDEMAVREARAGAAAVSAEFIAVNTRVEDTIADWVKRYPEITTSPTIMTFGRGSDEPVTRLTEFSDREIVAQAAINTRTRVVAANLAKKQAAKKAAKDKAKKSGTSGG